MSFGMGFPLPATAWQGGGGATLNLNFLSGTLPSSVTFSRGTTGTYYNSSGVLASAAIDTPRFDYDPSTLQLRGLLIEGARTNLLLNSLLDGTNLSTQSVIVTAVAHTLSFYGTGTVDLTGAFVSTVVGTGAYPTRTILTFTPTAASLTLTVTGTVQYAQLEIGSMVSSFIPTTGVTASRNADNASITSIPWFNESSGTMFVEAICNAAAAPAVIQYLASISDSTTTNRLTIARNASSTSLLTRVNATAVGIPTNAVNGVVSKSALAYTIVATTSQAALAGSVGVAATTVPSAPIPATRLSVGADEPGTGNQLYGWVRNISYYNTRLPNTSLQSITT